MSKTVRLDIYLIFSMRCHGFFLDMHLFLYYFFMRDILSYAFIKASLNSLLK